MSLQISLFRTSECSCLFRFFQFRLPGARKWIRGVVWGLHQWKPLPFDCDNPIALSRVYAGVWLFFFFLVVVLFLLQSVWTGQLSHIDFRFGVERGWLVYELLRAMHERSWVTRDPSLRWSPLGSSLPHTKQKKRVPSSAGVLFGFVEPRAYISDSS